jgi:iron complex outermembrane receptor protein
VIGGAYPNCLFTASAEHSGESWLLGADYRVSDDLLVYGNLRRGYKSGGYNIVVAIFDSASNPNFPFEPETVDAVELGAKWDWRLGSIPGRTNIALYESRYDNVQVFVNVLIPPFTTRVVQNAAKATIRGFEIEGEVRPLESLALTYGYSYTDASYDRYITPTGEDRSGLPFLYTPEQQFNVGFDWDLPIDVGVGELALSGTYSWQGDVFAGFADPGAPFTTIESYGLANLRLEWNNITDRIDAAIFVNNLEDKEYRVANYQQYDGIGTVVSLYGPPRMWGITLRGRF